AARLGPRQPLPLPVHQLAAAAPDRRVVGTDLRGHVHRTDGAARPAARVNGLLLTSARPAATSAGRRSAKCAPARVLLVDGAHRLADHAIVDPGDRAAA